MFINELRLYIHYLKGLISKASIKITAKEAERFAEFRQNLMDGIEYYKTLVNHFLEERKKKGLIVLLSTAHPKVMKTLNRDEDFKILMDI